MLEMSVAGTPPHMHPLTRAELGPDDLGALGGGCQGHCQGWGGDLDREEGQSHQRAGSKWMTRGRPLGREHERLETKVPGQIFLRDSWALDS